VNLNRASGGSVPPSEKTNTYEGDTHHEGNPDRGCTDVRGEPPDPTPGTGIWVSEVHHTQERPGASQ